MGCGGGVEVVAGDEAVEEGEGGELYCHADDADQVGICSSG